MASLEDDMTAAARDLLGSGFQRSYYRNAASEFIQIAESYAAEVRNPHLPAIKAFQEKLVLQQREARSGKNASGPESFNKHFYDGRLGVLTEVLEFLRTLT